MICISKPTYEMQHAFLNLRIAFKKWEADCCIKMHTLGTLQTEFM